jgi:hypothetical protein
MSNISYRCSLSDGWNDRLDRLKHPEQAEPRLKEVVGRGYDISQASVHIITRSLKASGQVFTEWNQAEKTATGTISYGGPSEGGINDPVVYAYYEQRRGGAHDFMQEASTVTTEAWARAILEWMGE